MRHNKINSGRHHENSTTGGVVVALSLSLCAQTEPAVVGSGLESADSYQIVERGPHHRVWSKVSWVATPLGALESQTNSYTELATGLHYRDASSGEWRESDPSFELNAEGYAVAARCQHQVVISPSLNPPDGVVVDLQTPEGRRLRSGLLGLNLFDPVSGKSLQIAAVRDVAGTQVSDTEIVWFDAFEGWQADVRVRNERGAFHQDVLLRERLSAEQLQRLGFEAATVRLEVWTEFVESPEPSLERKAMNAGTNETLRADGVPGAVDERVDFGVMRMEWGSGKAFAEPEAGGAIRIFKEWQKLEGRQFLIESAGYEELRPLLESLPVKTAALDAPAPAARTAWHRAPLQRSASARKTGAQSLQTAQLQPPSNSVAVVLDYVILNSGITDYTFRGDLTYYLSAAVTASGTTTFEGGAVLKYAANASLNLYAPGVINWKAAPYRPCFFTAKDDNTVGENISGSTGNPAFGAYANPALNLQTYSSLTLSHFRIAYAQKAVTYQYAGLTFLDGQFVHCAKGLSFSYGGASLRNALFANVERAFSELGYCSISAEHVTFGGRVNYPTTPAYLATSASGNPPYGFTLKNCILARLTTFAQGNATQTGDYNGFWKNSNPPFGDDPIACPEGLNPFADGGAGDYYLAQDSPFRDVGWATVNPGLAESLRQRTTTPPILHASVTWNSGNLPDLSRRSIRDDDFMPDLGYHYEVLDYIFHDLQTSTTVRLEGGVVVGVQGSDTGWGLRLQDGGHLESVAGPAAMNRIVSFQHVQESPPPVATTGYFARPGNVWLYHSGGTDPTRRMVFRFTDLAVGQGCGATVLSVAGAAPFAEVTFQDCHVRGGLVSVGLVQVNGPRTIRWVNNVWERATPRVFYYAGSNPSPYHQHPVTLDCRNNLFRDSYLLLIYQAANGTTGIWEVKDNLFDQTGNVATTDSAGAVLLQRSHNAATAGMVNNLGGSWYRTDLERDYVSGPRGEYYYPQSGGPYSLAQLRDAGSRSALAAGLACATPRADHQPDEDTVDIGFHYRLSGDPPVAVGPLEFSTCRNQDLELNLAPWAWSPNGCPLSWSLVPNSGPWHGTLLGALPEVTYRPAPGYCGPDSFQFRVSDGGQDSEPATVNIYVGDPYPTANCQDVMTGINTPVTFTLSGADACDDDLTFTMQTDPEHGQITAFDPDTGVITYAPNSGFEGTDTFWFTANNCGFSSHWQSATIHVVPGPVLAVECLPLSILLKWTLPEWLQFGFAKEFRIYRCSTSSGTCVPTALYATVDDPQVIGNPALWQFADTDVQAGTVYCYRVTFTRANACDSEFVYESPYSNTECSTTCCPPSNGPFWTDYGGTAQELAQWIVGPGFTVQNATYTGAAVAKGTFGNGFSANFPINTGVILSSGDIALAKGTNNVFGAQATHGRPGDSDLDDLLGDAVTEDAAILEFEIISATATNLVFEYIFASEEYPEFVGSAFNDLMAIFVNGVNIATVPNTSIFVGVNTVNGGFEPHEPATNPDFYVDNADPNYSALEEYAALSPVYAIQFDGTTVVLTAETSVSANTTYHIKIAIADASDDQLDSAAFIKAQVPCP